MQFEMHELTSRERYKLMTSTIMPRPIAWVTTQSIAGERNLAPYSFFNMISADPPLVALGLMRRDDGSYKDTAANIIETGEFVVNMVTESDVKQMNFSCIDAPPEFDEIAGAGIKTVPSHVVAPLRIPSSPANMECRVSRVIELSPVSTMVLGEVIILHIDDRIIDAERLHIDPLGMKLVARMHGAGWYARCTDLFQLDRPDFANLVKPKP